MGSSDRSELLGLPSPIPCMAVTWAAGPQRAPWSVFSQDAGLKFAHPPSTGLLCPQKQLGSCSHAKCTCIYSCVLYPTCSTSTPSALAVLLQQIFQCQILYEHKKKKNKKKTFLYAKVFHGSEIIAPNSSILNP